MRKMALLLLFAVSARAELKNVKVLTGLSEVRLQRTMNMMRASLGVHCDYCHVVRQGSGWDFASDEKPAKSRAREMIRLVGEINHTAFKGEPVVSCYTCHRGAVQPVSLVPLPQAAPPFPTPVRTADSSGLPDAKTIVGRYAAALGDVSRLTLPRTMTGERTTHTSRVVRSSGETPNEEVRLPVDVVDDGTNVRVTFHDPKGTVDQVLRASGGWVRDREGTHAMPHNGEENFRATMAAQRPVLPSSFTDAARTTGKEGDLWVVTQGNERFFFDAGSGLLVRRVVLTETPVGTIPQQTDYGDYREVDGVHVPFRVSVLMVDPWQSATWQYTTEHVGAKVDEAQFEMPK